MKTRIQILTILLMISSIGFSQIQPFGHLTIFSEDGDKFILILNGEQINEEPQTNLRVEELINPHYNAKIIFEDEGLLSISKNFLRIADVDGIMSDVTYKVRKKRGKLKLSYFSSVPVVEGFVVPSNVYVTRYGHSNPPVQEIITQEEGSITQTTTTSSTVGIDANVNLPGINVNVSVNDPLGSTTIKETTIVTTTDGYVDDSEHGSYYNDERNNGSRGCKNKSKMWQQDFKDALSSIKNIGYDQTKLETAKQIVSGNCMSAIQIKHICDLFGYEASKLDFAKYAFDYCVEPNNYFKVHKTFNATTSINELNEYIQNSY
ncbi:DUF4476 domain-containing protein [uncultured Aquimarina sp.]|uniref:DUF4476 domain-containing protein n=1 Tax=uncultured Aquimarina sp. TaxID=575652 RepID=UPI00261DEFFF|nr:DUF4476 domain-containing protein [uncultured Aquimarina sp.]